jgi:hypothetical protein
VPRVSFPEWRDDTGSTRYPFADAASLTTVDGLAFARALFLDAAVYPVGGLARAYLSRITVGPREVVVAVGDPGQAVRATAAFDPLAPPADLALADEYGRPAGLLVTDPTELTVFQTWPRTEHRFAPGATEFAAGCVTPLPEVGVRGFMTADGELFAGDVWLVGEDGVVVRREGDAVRVDVVGDPLFRRRLCQPAQLFTTPRFVRTINGMRPDERGDFKLTVGRALAADTVLRVYPDEKGGLTIEAVGQPVQGVR